MRAVIIGAGVAGLGIGWRLLQAGWEVTILDRGQPGFGATRAAAGMLAVTAELQHAPQPERDFALVSNRLWPEFVTELEQASGRDIGFRRSGTLLLAADAAEREAMRPRGTLVDGAGARALAPLLGETAGGLWVPDEAHVDPRLLGEALAVAFLKAGGRLVPNEAVVAVERQDGRAVSALTPYGRHGADAFVIAAGAWSGLLDIPITPVKGEVIALASPDGAALPGPVIWGNGVYCVPRRDRLLIGATMQQAGFDTGLTLAARDHLRGRAEALMPSLKNWALADHWAGLRPASPDGLPLLGPTETENLFVASGQYRNGILFAPAVARMMADLVRGQGAVIPEFDPRRFA
jgi:glycine oxidase ThiO